MFPPYLQTAFVAWGSRGITLLYRLVTIPLLLQALGTEKYAALVVLTSLEAWFLLLDFGVGTSIQNHLSENLFHKQEEKALVKTALVLAFCAFGVGALLFILLQPLLEGFLLEKFLHENGSALRISACFFLIGTFGSIASKILIARQKGFVVYLTQGMASLISLLFLLLAYKNLNLVKSLFFTIGVSSFFSLVLSLVVFWKVDIQAPIRFEVVKRAKGFWFFSCMAALVLSSDGLIISRTLESAEIVQYHLLVKIFGVGAFMYSAVLQGLWPSCSEKWAMGDGHWVVKKISFFSFIGILCALFFTGIIFFSKETFERFFFLPLSKAGILWSGVYLCVRIFADFHAMALQSRSDLKLFFYLVPIQAVCSLVFQWFLSSFFGLSGIFAGLVLSYVFTVCFALPKRLFWLRDSVCLQR